MLKSTYTRILEDSSALSYVEYGGPEQVVSEKNNINIWMETTPL